MRQELKVAYSRNDDKIFAQTPDYEGYTTALVQNNSWKSEKQITDPAYIAESFENTELENIKGLYHEGKITGETSSRLLMGVDSNKLLIRSKLHHLHL